MRCKRMRPNPLGCSISTAMAITTLYQHCVGVVLAVFPGDWRFPISDRKVCLIHLDQAMQALPIRPHHGLAKPVQHCPRRLVAAQAQHALQTQSTDTELLVGDIPDCGEARAQRRAGFVEDRAGCGGALGPHSLHSSRLRLTREGGDASDEKRVPRARAFVP